MILQRNGQFFAGRLSTDTPPIPLQEIDIILLSLFEKGNELEKANLEFNSNSIVKHIYPSIPESAFNQRAEQFIQNGLLISESAIQMKSSYKVIEPTIIESQDNFPVANESLQLITNFALIPSADGFLVWSSLNRQYYHFNLVLILTLLFAVKPENQGKILSVIPSYFNKAEFQRNISWLLENKILLIKTNKKDSLPNGPLPELINDQPIEKAWKKLLKDDRIPIYFVPHMENHYPLALGLIFSAIEAFDNGSLLKKFQLIPITYLSPEDFINGPYKKFGKGVWFFSNYMWSLETNLLISQFTKQHSKGNLTVHGGPSTPDYRQKCIDFFTKNSSVDITVHGEGEAAITDILKCVSKSQTGSDISYEQEQLSRVAGISYRDLNSLSSYIITTDKRVRLKEPDAIPSPYNRGYFNDYSNNVEAAIIESNRGCPFGCTFCDWGSATNQKIRKYDLERVKKEIEWIAKNKIQVLWIADANFGLYDRDIELSVFIIKMREQYQYPNEVVVNYTKNTTWRLAEIIKIFSKGGIISQGVISIQTTDEKTLEVINRKNIKIDKYDELSSIFRESNLPLSTDLMLGLPGITPDALKNDLQRYFDFDVSVKAYPTQLLPNSPMADPDYIAKYKIETDENDFLISTFSYTRTDLDEMKALYKLYTVADGYSLLRYVLRFLQWEHQLKAIDVLWTLNVQFKSNPSAYPKLAFVAQFFETDKFIPGGWRGFYDEFARFIFEQYGIERDSAFDVVLKVNEAAMPDESCSYPLQLDLNHDFENYFMDNRIKKTNLGTKSLNEYSASHLKFDDPDGMANIDSRYLQYDSHQFFWEIRSPMIRAKSASDIH